MFKFCRQMLLLFITLCSSVWAEDIDLFVGVPPEVDGKANVLVILDNTSNWNDAFPTEKAALVRVFQDLDPNSFNVGLMMFGVPEVGYVRAAMRDMATEITYTGDTYAPGTYTANFLYAAMINDFEVRDDAGAPRTLARTFSEAYAYLMGLDSRDGKQLDNDFRDYHDNPNGDEFTRLIHELDPFTGNALSTSGTLNYNQPPPAGVCAGTYVIYIGNTVPSGNVVKDNDSRNTKACEELAPLDDRIDFDQCTPSSEGNWIGGFTYTAHQGNYADEWARYMYEEHGIVFYAIDVDPTDRQPNGLSNSELLFSLSERNGGGRYFKAYSDDQSQLEDIIGGVFAEIQAENSVFASVALPASTTGNSVFLNQVFIGLFRPDENALPYWPGNLKQYRLGLSIADDLATVRLEDSRPPPMNAAINPTTGFVTECAQSFWTPDPDTSDDYWEFAAQGLCKNGIYREGDSPDGPYVEKGAQSYVTRREFASSPTGRKIFTCDADAINDCTTLTDFDTENSDIKQGQLDPNNPLGTSRNGIINWALGQDLEDDNRDDDDTDIRAYIHGDVIHSRPVAVNYGTDLNPSVAVYYGANDGTLRAINGNQTDDLGGVSPGEELWAFMPPEFYPQIKALKDNVDPIKFPATGPGAAGKTGISKPYGMDATVNAYQGDIDDDGDGDPADVLSGQKLIFTGMRRGGRSVYGFDVTDPNDPALLWKKGCGTPAPDTSDCATESGTDNWQDIGQTWSAPGVAFISGQTNPILIMGGGYDTCEDTDNDSGNANHSCASGTTGDHIYVFDAYDGDLLRVFDVVDHLGNSRSVPGGITIVSVTEPSDTTPNPLLQYAYATDTGGNVWRISGPGGEPISTTTSSEDIVNWQITQIAALGCPGDASATCAANKKFLFGPDIVRNPKGSNNFRVLVGSGDREKPLVSYGATAGVQNYFHSFVDIPQDDTWYDDAATECAGAFVCMDVLAIVSRSIESVDPIADVNEKPYGYAVQLSPEEQVVTGALVVDDIANFSTHIPYDPNDFPDADECINQLGTATTYNIGFEDAGGDLIDILTGGLVPTPVAGKVLICESDNDCTEVPFCIGCGGERSPIGGGTVGTGTSYSRGKGRVYWNIEQ